ncbi:MULTISPECIES: NADH:ubiquinone reductase (Na(+)-transporting) subunit C [unclassified Porphyromonas]|uniref:NADH:ubiquinone reductase (Na(+)-transporting) subunit C n=1 Tax=unclassified Porphyromonas TaxID=2645799 RepID=UPI00052C2546|nr:MULTISPECIES: NADH:ubiquinone reductase (Na(+)-transporting) subunit C [unclassified Porphyromonas]KGN82582.1 Na(+)-translocating NADH-quinone reductase subunit C [Porphyromonas sp. COT-290 OH860]KGN97881.1 Na(+)-translocating NADH-quinone reductase subunit C [Porphyromonas sp. COT-290 OH3588]
MNTDKNSYTIIYAAIMVVVAAVLLAGAATVLKPAQQANEKIDKMQQILRSVGQTPEISQVEATYKTIIKKELLVDLDGSVKSEFDAEAESKAFKLNTENLFKVFAKEGKAEDGFPLYIAEVDGKTAYILPMNGAGLWGPIWGYIALDAADHSTVIGVDFGNKGETPGLGAEISTPTFANLFVGKQVYRDGAFKSIAVVKAGKVLSDQDYVDGISGGTLTSDGVHAMLEASISPYQKFLESYNAQ